MGLLLTGAGTEDSGMTLRAQLGFEPTLLG